MKKSLIFFHAAAIACAACMTSCVDNEEGDGLKYLREGIGEYYKGKANVENANAETIRAKQAAVVAAAQADAKAKEITNAYTEASNNIKLLVEESNKNVTLAKNDRAIENEKVGVKTDTAGAYYKILAALQKQQATQIGQEEELKKLQILYASVIAAYQEEARFTMAKLEVTKKENDETVLEKENALNLKVIKAAYEYAYDLNSANITKTEKELKAQLDNAEAVAKNEKTKENSALTVLGYKKEVEALVKKYNDTMEEYEKAIAEAEASANYSEEAKEYEKQIAKATYDKKISDLEAAAKKAIADAVAADKANETANAANDANASADDATSLVVAKLNETLQTYIKAIETAQKAVTSAASDVDAKQKEIVAKELEIVKKQIELNSAVTSDTKTLEAAISTAEKDLKQAQDKLTDAQKAEKEAQDDLTKKQAEYKETVTPYEEAEAQLKTLKEAVDAAQKTYDTANDNKTIATSNLGIASTALGKAQTTYSKFTADSVTAAANLKAKNEALKAANEALKTAQENWKGNKEDASVSQALATASSNQAIAAAEADQAKTTAAYYSNALSVKYLTDIKTQKKLVEQYTYQITQCDAKMAEATTAKDAAESRKNAFEGAQYKTAKANYDKAKTAQTDAETALANAKEATAKAEGTVAEKQAALAKAQADLESFNTYKRNQEKTDAAQAALVKAQNELNEKLAELDSAQKTLDVKQAELAEAESNYNKVKEIVDKAAGIDTTKA